MNNQRQYWDKKIIEWSASGYKRDHKKISFIERLAYPFRKADKRYVAGLELIGPIAKNKIILDLGFGVADFSFGILKYNPQKVIGIDIADSAVAFATKIAKKKEVGNRVSFRRGDVSEMRTLPRSDIVVGLGFIDYLNADQLKHFFKLLEGKKYLFSYFEKKLSLFNIVHSLYVKIQNCPGAFKFTKKEMRHIIPLSAKASLISKNNLIFITNIPNLKELDWQYKL